MKRIVLLLVASVLLISCGNSPTEVVYRDRPENTATPYIETPVSTATTQIAYSTIATDTPTPEIRPTITPIPTVTPTPSVSVEYVSSVLTKEDFPFVQDCPVLEASYSVTAYVDYNPGTGWKNNNKLPLTIKIILTLEFSVDYLIDHNAKKVFYFIDNIDNVPPNYNFIVRSKITN